MRTQDRAYAVVMFLPILLGALLGAGASQAYNAMKRGGLGLDPKSPVLVRIADPNLLTFALAQGVPVVKGAIDQAIVRGLQSVTVELRPWNEALLRARLVYADSASATAAATAGQSQVKAMLPALAAGVGPIASLKDALTKLKIVASGPIVTVEAPVPPAYLAMLHAAATPAPAAHAGQWSAIEDHMGQSHWLQRAGHGVGQHYLNRPGAHTGEWSAIEDHMGGLAQAACAQTGMLQ